MGIQVDANKVADRLTYQFAQQIAGLHKELAIATEMVAVLEAENAELKQERAANALKKLEVVE